MESVARLNLPQTFPLKLKPNVDLTLVLFTTPLEVLVYGSLTGDYFL